MILIQKQKYTGGIKANGLLDVSGSKLAEALGIRVYTPRIIAKRKYCKIAINWGLSFIPWWYDDIIDDNLLINTQKAIKNASNKINTLIILADNAISIPLFTMNRSIAEDWFNTPKTIVFCRTLLSGKQGEGIVVARKPEELVDAPLYTLYIPKQEEYRFHIAFNKVIHIQKKLRLTSVELEERGIININPLIRNISNGYVFTSNIPLEYEDDGSYKDTKFFWMTEYSIHAVKALGLDFGAVDIIVGKDGRLYILEINTAPGIEGKTLEAYTSAFKDRFNLT